MSYPNFWNLPIKRPRRYPSLHWVFYKRREKRWDRKHKPLVLMLAKRWRRLP